MLPIPHRLFSLVADGLTWNVRQLAGEPSYVPKQPDPFLPPYDDRLCVAKLGPQHVLLLNKYPVLQEHLLIVTQEALPQSALPDPSDFAAIARLLDERACLAFYNGGHESGASQPHRHFQAVALPLGPAPDPIPTGDWVWRASNGLALPFPGAAASITASSWEGAAVGDALHTAASELLRRCGRDTSNPGSFNLLLTREWMLAVPRVHRQVQKLSINSLGYAGALIVKSDAELEVLEQKGPLALLRTAAASQAADELMPGA